MLFPHFFSTNPENSEISIKLGMLYLKSGDTQRAFQQFGTVLAKSPACATALYPMAYIIQVKHLKYFYNLF